ncbi:MAG: ubiquinol-cytochrome c reductase iron-sulfur subunit [Anaerolineales bacterium]|jgi:cytochrome b6-f complex iron-sulfur subunit
MAETKADQANDQQEESKTKMNRREFLNMAWLASLGFITLSIGGVTILFAYPRFREGEFGGVSTLGTVGELPSVDAEPLNDPKLKLWLTRPDAGVLALYKVCTHLGCLYGWSDQEVKFICPCHGSQFQYNGTYIQGPAPRSLDRFVVQAVNPDTGEVLYESVDGNPLPVPDDPNVVIRVDTGRLVRGQRHG